MEMKMPEFALGMGSNVGDRMKNLVEGVRFILSRYGMGSFHLSGVYETSPIEGVEGDSFLNCVLKGTFFGTVDELMRDCREAEILMGSMINKNNTSRTLDIDLLFFGNTSRSDENLILPHPRLKSRKFVLQPLSDVWQKEVPGLNATPDILLKECADTGTISIIRDVPESGCIWEVTD